LSSKTRTCVQTQYCQKKNCKITIIRNISKAYIPINGKNLEDMEKFLDVYDLQNLNQEDIKYLNKSLSSNENESVIKCLPKKEKPRTGWSHC
jgi:ribosome-binding protein aMBF1 (putative translation factor)